MHWPLTLSFYCEQFALLLNEQTSRQGIEKKVSKLSEIMNVKCVGKKTNTTKNGLQLNFGRFYGAWKIELFLLLDVL